MATAMISQPVRIALLVSAVLLLVARPSPAQSRRQYEAARRSMVQNAVIGAGVTDHRVLDSLLATPRHEFVIPKLRDKAYFDMALPIGNQQTISSPFIVAFMTQSIDPQPTDKVLEIGTGSGYQAAILSPLVKEVYSIEIVKALGDRAQRTLRRLKYKNVITKVGDGYQGWEEHAPFDKIIVTCSPEEIPQPLVTQLKEGGLMVIPVGERFQQTLYLLRKKNGKLESEALRPTLFVPMTGRAEDNRLIKPDPLNPKILNGGFENPPDVNQFVPGWYYQRRLIWETDSEAPEGESFVTFRNQDKGRSAHLLQGFPIDGRQVIELKISAMIRHSNTLVGQTPGEFPAVAISFYDESRKDLGTAILGPFYGTQPWRSVSKQIRVPPKARAGILRIGLFGAIGEISFDNLEMVARKK